jgi:lipoprotein-anchoring transpeptidase ErfK/SrfK
VSLRTWPAGLAIAVVLFAGCSSESGPESTLRLRGSAPAAVAGAAVYAVGTAKGPSVSVYEDRGGIWPSRFLANPQPDGSALVLLVEEQQPGWLKVLLPIRPNGSTGWIREADVTVATHDFRIDVEVGARRLTVWKGSEVFLRETVGVGAPSTPTTLGRFYTTALFDTSRTQPDFGPYAYPLSGYSEVLYDYLGGEGQMGIHGTDDPSSLGRNVSHGCVRMSNASITRLAKALPVGVPVEIRP